MRILLLRTGAMPFMKVKHYKTTKVMQSLRSFLILALLLYVNNNYGQSTLISAGKTTPQTSNFMQYGDIPVSLYKASYIPL